MKKTFLGLVLFGLGGWSIARAAAPLKEDQIVVYGMKEDPTLATFLSVPVVSGFYALEVDEELGNAVLFYQVGDTVYRADADLKVKGDQLTLKYQKKRKTFVRATSTLSEGVTHEILYPTECPPERGGWRHGPSFERNVIHRGDEMNETSIIRRAHLEFQMATERCVDFPSDCEAVGCPEWEVAKSSAPAPVKKVVVAPSPPPVAKPADPLFKALLEAKMGEAEILSAYRSDIDTILPPSLNDKVVATIAGFRTSNMPYPFLTDPFIEQRNLKIGVLSKKYLLEDNVSTMTVEIEPLMEEFQPGHPNKCGSWSADSTKSFFDVRGQPGIYSATGGASLCACGETVSITLTTTSTLTREALTVFLDALPFTDIERIAGGKK